MHYVLVFCPRKANQGTTSMTESVLKSHKTRDEKDLAENKMQILITRISLTGHLFLEGVLFSLPGAEDKDHKL